MLVFDSSPAYMPGSCFWLPGPISVWFTFRYRRGLPVLARAVSRRANGSGTTPGLLGTRDLIVPAVLPSRQEHTVGTRIAFFEARFPARRCLCLHFTRPLTVPSARLEVKMVRYSFLVGLFHPRLHAGLSRRLRRGRDGCYQPPPAQTRTCGTTAYGSYLGCAAWRRTSKRTSGKRCTI
jgi:hypothetical protein